MKKLLFIVAVLAISMSSFAQVTYGVKAGTNISNINYSGDGVDVSPDSKVGLAAGIFARFSLSENFAIQPEILYSSKGSKMDISESGYSYSETLKLSYLSIPVIGKYYVNSGFNLQVGPQFDFLLSAKDDWSESYDGDSDSGEDDIKDSVNGLDFGLSMGLGYDFDFGFGIDARYMLGLSELQKEAEDGLKTKSKGFQISLSYAF